jgi:transcription initiation factor IIE alpha subunit
MELRQQGLTFEEIGEHFGISHELVRKVLRALCRREGMPMPPAKDPKGRVRFKIQETHQSTMENSV